MNASPKEARAIFVQAVKLDSAQWDAFLAEHCGENADLRQQVMNLLQANQKAGSFLNAPAIAPPATVDQPPITERPGTVIGNYKLLEQIGEGGFGVVFMAEQTEPVKRKVALKILKPGMDTKQVVARFEAERQALAIMDHPNIAHVYDAGSTESGRPYFVMELVKGIPITEYCDDKKLDTRERLQLFLQVCRAIQHAHQKGIIHRDIKPNNVLVTPHDGVPVVKVIDFGIAKAMSGQLTDKTVFTGFAQMIGTPLYMSPEQAEINALDVDTRSDIYSLGVLMYELLTGTTPFDSETLKKAGYDELRRIIREDEPPRPSARISTMGKLATTRSEQRKSDPRKLSQSLRGELDWIVMKSLEKDRRRRYETANSFADDVERYLNNEPVQACPPSMWYTFSKYYRRHRVSITITGFIALLLLAFTGVVGYLLREQQVLRGEANASELKRIASEERRLASEKKANLANRQMRETELDDKVEEAVRIFYRPKADMNDAIVLLTNVIKERPSDPKLFLFRGSAFHRLQQHHKAIRDLEESLQGELSSTAAAHWLIAESWKKLKQPEKAEKHRKLVKDDFPGSVEALVTEAIALGNERSIELLTEAIHRQPFNEELYLHRGSIASDWCFRFGSYKYFDLAVADLEKVWRGRPDNRKPLWELCFCLQVNSRGKQRIQAIEKSKQYLDEWRKHNPDNGQARWLLANYYSNKGDHKARIAIMNNGATWHTGNAYANLGQHEKAIESFTGLLKRYRRAYVLADRAACYAHLGKTKLARQDLDSAEKLDSPEKRSSLDWDHILRAYSALNDFEGARKVVEEWRKWMPNSRGARNGFSKIYFSSGYAKSLKNQLAEAIVDYSKAIEANPANHRAWNNRGTAYARLRQYTKALTNHAKAVELNPKDAQYQRNFATTLQWLGKRAEAMKAFEEAARLQPNNIDAHLNLASILQSMRKYQQAEKVIFKIIQLRPNHAYDYYQLARTQKRLGALDKAEANYKKAFNIDPNYAQAYCDLGLMLQDLDRFAEGLEYIRQGHKLGMARKIWTNPSARWIKETERRIELNKKLEAILAGNAEPASEAERIELARFCAEYKKFYGAATQFYLKTAPTKPGSSAHHRAFFAAIRAGTGQGKDADRYTEADRQRWRAKAHEWLGTEYQARVAEFSVDKWLRAKRGEREIEHFLADTTLSAVRDEAHLQKLPADEQSKWRRLWNQFRNLKKLAGNPPITAPSSIAAGQLVIHDELTKDDPLNKRLVESHQKDYLVEVKAGEVYQIDVESIDVDTFLQIETPKGMLIGSDDDGGAGLNSRLLFAPKFSGLRTIIVTTYPRGQTGRFRLTIRLKDSVIAALRDAIQQKKDLGNNHRKLGDLFRQQRKFKEAAANYREAINYYTKGGKAHFGKLVGTHFSLGGMLCDEMKDYSAAEEVFRQTLQLVPKNGTAHYNLGNALAGQGKLKEGVKCYRSAITYLEKNGNPQLVASAHLNLSKVQWVLDDQAEAIQSLRKVVELRPNVPSILNDLAWYLATAKDPKQRKPQDAVTFSLKALKQNPTRWPYWNTLGVAYYRAEKYRDSIAALEKSIQLSTVASPFDCLFLGMAHWQLGEKKNARQWYNKAVQWTKQNQPNNEELLRFRAEADKLITSEKGKSEEKKLRS